MASWSLQCPLSLDTVGAASRNCRQILRNTFNLGLFFCIRISPRFPLFRRVPKVRNQSHHCTRSNDPSHKVGWILYKVTRQRSLQIGTWLPTIVLKTIVRSDRGKFESVFFRFFCLQKITCTMCAFCRIFDLNLYKSKSSTCETDKRRYKGSEFIPSSHVPAFAELVTRVSGCEFSFEPLHPARGIETLVEFWRALEHQKFGASVSIKSNLPQVL